MASARTEFFFISNLIKIQNKCKTSRQNLYKFTVRNGAKAKNPPKQRKNLKTFNVWKVLDVFVRRLQVSSGSRSKKARLAPEKGRNYMILSL
jgi:hypothetical protein